jgi:hypothetical protein
MAWKSGSRIQIAGNEHCDAGDRGCSSAWSECSLVGSAELTADVALVVSDEIIGINAADHRIDSGLTSACVEDPPLTIDVI